MLRRHIDINERIVKRLRELCATFRALRFRWVPKYERNVSRCEGICWEPDLFRAFQEQRVIVWVFLQGSSFVAPVWPCPFTHSGASDEPRGGYQ